LPLHCVDRRESLLKLLKSLRIGDAGNPSSQQFPDYGASHLAPLESLRDQLKYQLFESYPQRALRASPQARSLPPMEIRT
jgi:hypothetical protein